MKPFLLVSLLIFLAAPPVAAAQSQSHETLAQFRAKYLGHRILIHNAETFIGSLMGWQPVRRTGNKYEVYDGAFIRASYAKEEPKVIAITLDDVAQGEAPNSKNALGETVSSEDPYVDFIVRFPDGQLAMITSFVSLLSASDSDIELVSIRNAHESYLRQTLPKVVGRAIYAVGDSKVFPLNSTLRDLTDILSTKLPLSNVPNLEPLRITQASYNATADRIILKLRLPGGRFGLVATQYNGKHGTNAFLSRVAGNFLVKIPQGLTAREITAIQGHKIFRGMPRNAVILSWGKPEKVNDWGSGGEQLVYDAGDQLVYISTDGRVTNWQSLSN